MPSSQTRTTGPFDGPIGRDRFHLGDRHTLLEVYRRHFDAVDRAVGEVLRGADRDTAVYEVFRRVLHEETFRRGFPGGDLRTWLILAAQDHALAYSRRHRRGPRAQRPRTPSASDADEAADDPGTRQLVEQLHREVLPPAWRLIQRRLRRFLLPS